MIKRINAHDRRLEQAADRIMGICMALDGPDDAFTILGNLLQIIACMAGKDRDEARHMLYDVAKEVTNQFDSTYAAHCLALKLKLENYKRMEAELVTAVHECLNQWSDAEPPPQKTATKH